MADDRPKIRPNLDTPAGWLDLFRQFPGFVMITSGPDHFVEFANAGLRELTRHREVIGRPVGEALPELNDQGFLAVRDEVYRTGKPHRGLGVLFKLRRRSDGELDEGYIDFVYQPIRGRDGKVEGIIFAGYDITEQKQAENRIRMLQSELVHVSRASAMGAMAITLAHELNQPLAAISNYAAAAQRRLASGDAPAADMATAFAEIEAASQRAGEIIRRARDMIGKDRSRSRRFDLADAIREALSIGLVDAPRQGISTRIDLAPDLIVLGDEIQFQQVVLNLLRNALEAMEECATRELEILSHEVGGRAEVQICDSGAGLTGEARSWLFEPFFTTKAHGLGVGLSISRSIVEGLGGEIWAEDRPKGGTRFCLKLPLAG